MNQEKYNNKTETHEEGGMTITDYLNLVTSNWYWFVLSVAACLSLAVLYLQITPRIYERSAQIMIKEDAKQGGGGSGVDEMAVLSELNFFAPKSNVNNEVELLRSKRMRLEVAKMLNLSTRYMVKSKLKTTELYRDSPVSASFPHSEDGEVFSFTLNVLSPEELELSEFKQGETIYPEISIKTRMSDTTDTPVGKIVIFPTLYNSEEYLNTPIYITKSGLNQTAEYLNINASADKNNTVITLSLADNVPARAEDVLNTLISVYNKDNIIYKNQVVEKTSDFIKKHLDIIEQELELVDKDISEYRSENMATDIQASTEIFLTESSTYNKQIFELQNQLSVAEFIKEYLINPANNNNLIPSSSGIDNSPVESQISEYNGMMLKRARLIENGSEKSPAVIELTNALIAMKQSIIRSIDNLIVVLGLQIKGLKNREEQTNEKIANVPKKEQEMIPIKRRLGTQEELYLYLLKKRIENELAGAVTISNFRIVNEAGGGMFPISPKSRMIMLAALIAGLLLPFTIIWLRESLNTSIRGPKDITDNLTVPYLGTVPQSRRKKKTKHDVASSSLIIKDNSRDHISEAFRVIRSNMDFMTTKNNAKVIMTTSFNIGSGKSFISLNLAMSFALTNKKIIIVDLDLRKAFVSTCVGSPKTGISAYLSGINSNLNELIVKEWRNPNLDILPVGKLPPNPAELLLSPKFKELLSILQKRYDYVFLDTTPINIVADASIVADSANMTIFVVRERLLDRRMLPELEQIYKTGKFSNMAVLLNASNMLSGKYYGRYGGYGRYGHYGHTYGYGN
ncbi:MAG: polysaccharide biosynthesis tyrosine autokinase [Prevotellaceae bacterium]|jgi:capsular exopolysaccharide synthesis family protein|nr:polysaccharide biosynthesis tyrosine autokinase [Prevotellaceae bacterium]